MTYTKIIVPSQGERITTREGKLSVPNNPILLWIEGDGIGPDIMTVSKRIWDAAVQKAYGGQRKIVWMEIYAGEKAAKVFGGDYFPAESLQAIRRVCRRHQRPADHPGGRRIPQPERGAAQGPRPLRVHPAGQVVSRRAQPAAPSRAGGRGDLPREHRGCLRRRRVQVRFAGGAKVEKFLKEEMGAKFFDNSGIGIKPISAFGTKRLVRKALDYAVRNGSKSVTFVHKGNIQKFTEGAFMQWGYELAKDEYGDVTITEQQLWDEFGGKQPAGKIIVKDRIADIMFQQMLLRPSEYDVIATPNLNGDYLSDAVAAEVGGVGIAPGANIGDFLAVFEATHGTAPKYANQDKVNPGSLLLSGVMMLNYIGWGEAARAAEDAITKTVADKIVTYDFARQMEGAQEVKTSEFASAVIARL